jgi:hypothetical protein
MAVLLKDNATPDKSVKGEVFLKADRSRNMPIRHSTGYFLFIDFPEGMYTLTAGGKFYEQQDFLIDTQTVDPREPFVELFLEQKETEFIKDKSVAKKGGNI